MDEKWFSWIFPVFLIILGGLFWFYDYSIYLTYILFILSFLSFAIYETEPFSTNVSLWYWAKATGRRLTAPHWSTFFFWLFLWPFALHLLEVVSSHSWITDFTHSKEIVSKTNYIAIAATSLSILFPLIILILETRSKSVNELIPKWELYLHYSWAVPISIILSTTMGYLGLVSDEKVSILIPFFSILSTLILFIRILRIVYFYEIQDLERYKVLKDHVTSMDRFLKSNTTQFSKKQVTTWYNPLPDFRIIKIRAEDNGFISSIDSGRIKEIDEKVKQFWNNYLEEDEQKPSFIEINVGENKDCRFGDLLVAVYIPKQWKPMFSQEEDLKRNLKKCVTIKPGRFPAPALVRRLEELIRYTLQNETLALPHQLEEQIMILLEKSNYVNYHYSQSYFDDHYIDYRDLIFDFIVEAYFKALDRTPIDLSSVVILANLQQRILALLIYDKQCESALVSIIDLFSTQAYYLLQQELRTTRGTDVVRLQIQRIGSLLWGIGHTLDNEFPSVDKKNYFEKISIPRLFKSLQDFGFYALKYSDQNSFNLVLQQFNNYPQAIESGVQKSLIGLG
ncbi:MAG: hypothetical protein OEY59_02620 [Deltaproteobacteria bacterium]|nr:hypothetical protein [Deltaproteobacteria bacterium]